MTIVALISVAISVAVIVMFCGCHFFGRRSVAVIFLWLRVMTYIPPVGHLRFTVELNINQSINQSVTVPQ